MVEMVNIFEGDTAELHARLFGVAPFELSWSRREGGQLETRHVDGVYDYQYKMTTGRSGVYKILGIKDRYCHYSVN